MAHSVGRGSLDIQNVHLQAILGICSDKPDEPEIVDSISFDWRGAYKTPFLADLRREAKLDAVIEKSENSYGNVIAMSRFVHGLWQHDGFNDPGTNNPLEIIKRASQGENFRCVEYARVLSACLRAIGIPARFLALKMADVETISSCAGHVVVEACVNNKWIMIDPQANFIPKIKGVPVNALELGRHLKDFGKQDVENGIKDIELEGCLDAYLSWIQPYLYYLDTFVDLSEEQPQRVMLVPVGAKCPTKFQITSSLDHFVYTRNENAFYADPS